MANKVLVSDDLLGVMEADVMRVARRFWNPIMKKLRAARGRLHTGDNPWGFFILPTEDGPAPLSFLCTTGCRFAASGGCTMCDYGASPCHPVEELMQGAKEALDHMEDYQKGRERILYNINATGSLFDEVELPAEVRRYIFQRIAAGCKLFPKVRVSTESRLEYLSEQKLKEMREILGPDIPVEIGIGIESLNPLIREGSINKHLPRDWEERLALVRKYGGSVALHLQYKPAFVSERETLEDTIASARYLLEKKLVDFLIIMMMNVRPTTLIGELYETGDYHMPNPWAVVEMMRELGPELCEHIGFFGFAVGNPFAKVARGCEVFEREVMPHIRRFSGYREEYDKVLQAADTVGQTTETYADWQARLAKVPEHTLPERLAAGLDYFGQKYLGRGFKEMLAEIG